MSTADLSSTFWYCLDHHRAETFGECTSHNRIGPFATEPEAARALETIAARERRYDAEDKAWENGD